MVLDRAARVGAQLGADAVSVVPVADQVAFQAAVTRPPAANDTRHATGELEGLVTVTSAQNPVDQSLVTVRLVVTEPPLGGAVVVVVLGGRVVVVVEVVVLGGRVVVVVEVEVPGRTAQ